MFPAAQNQYCLRKDAKENSRIGRPSSQNHSWRGIVDTRDQTDQRAFSRARWTYDRHAAAGRNTQIQIMQHAFAVVFEIQPAEFDLAQHFAIVRCRIRL